jgi:DNA-binding IclR family transcriptional regulator
VEKMAGLFRPLGDPACLQILEFLATKERSVPECVAHTGLLRSSVRAHLASLEGLGWIEAGHHASYRLADPRAAELILLARTLAASNAGALVQCLHLDQSPPCS